MKAQHYGHVLLLCLISSAAQAATLEQIETANGSRWRMQNDRVEIFIDPARGARIDQFHDKAFDLPVIRNAIVQGLFVDHAAKQNWPGELWERVYKVKPLVRKGEEVVLQTTTIFEGKFRNTEFPKLTGLVLQKTFRLRDSEAGVRVEHVLRNPTEQALQIGLWVQNILQLGPNPKQNVAVRPARAGIYRFVMPEQPKGEGWSRYQDSIAAWHGVVDPATQHGVFFTQDWDYLDAHYNAGKAYTVEWFMAPVSIPPGGNWSTRSQMISRKIDPNVIIATPDYCISAALSEDERAIAWRVVGDKISIKGTLHEPRTGKSHSVNLELDNGSHVVKLPKAAEPPLFLEANIAAGDEKSAYVAEFFGGEHFPRNEPLPGYPPLFEVALPARHPVFPRPKQIVIHPSSGKRVLLATGVVRPSTQIGHALRDVGYEVVEVFEERTGKTTAITEFPSLYETILGFETIVLNNIDCKLLSAAQRQIFTDWLEAGGRLLVLGGSALASPNWENNPLKQWIPFTPTQTFTTRPKQLKGKVKGPDPVTTLMPDHAFAITWESGVWRPNATLDDNILIARHNRVLVCGLTSLGRTAPPAQLWQYLMQLLYE